jgi:hypothetical protein
MKWFWEMKSLHPQTHNYSWTIFYAKLNWYYLTVTAIEKANKAKQTLQIISKFFSPQEMVKNLNCTFLQ